MKETGNLRLKQVSSLLLFFFFFENVFLVYFFVLKTDIQLKTERRKTSDGQMNK